MSWCPKCNAEYREGYTQCSNCGELLVNREPEEKSDIVFDAMEPYLLASVSNQTEAAMIIGLLQEVDIPFLVKDRGVGGYLKVYMGFSIYGEDIYVDKSRYAQAKELLDSCLNSVDENTILQEENQEEEVHVDDTYYRPTRQRIARFIILFMVLTMVLSFILNSLN